ncbi:MAG TPA: DMT family transporter [Polyangia bacterium]|nr:DMT family transporter [Polyangia bacterium]
MGVPGKVWIFLAVGLVAASQSGNIIRIGDAHPLAIAAWRLLIAAVLFAPLAGRRLGQLAGLTWKDRALLALAGLTLALHFVAWIAAVQMTTVANAAVVFAINPVLTAIAAWLIFRERVSGRLAVAIALGLAGVALLGWSNLSFEPGRVSGDGAALLCSALFTAYFLLGKRLRNTLDTTVYVTALYGSAAACCFAGMAILDLPLVDYDGRTWLCFALMALVPTMIGHTSFNNAVRWIPAGRIATLTLSEPMLAGVVAYFAWGEAMTGGLLAGYVLICASVLVVALERRNKGPGDGPAVVYPGGETG